MSTRCLCGHEESMHYGPSGECKKVTARDPRLENHQRCTCRDFRPPAAPLPVEGEPETPNFASLPSPPSACEHGGILSEDMRPKRFGNRWGLVTLRDGRPCCTQREGQLTRKQAERLILSFFHHAREKELERLFLLPESTEEIEAAIRPLERAMDVPALRSAVLAARRVK